ncbi:MAG TPA: PilN domain-containing protein [Gallionellaceae bacterium]|nr:PilN domain-containing protein [Gallionellaceae bacterium]
MMEPLKLDYQANARNIWIGIMILAAGLAWMLIVVWYYQEENGKISDQETLAASVRNISAFRVSAASAEGDAEQVSQEIKQANAVILELGLPWKELFEAFESSQKKNVAVLAIEPDAQKGLVRISGEAKSLDSLPDYLAYLQKVPLFQDVVLLNHQIQDQDPQKPARFMLQAAWGERR